MSDRRTTRSRTPESESRPRERSLIIAIDGPSGAGKGTIARAVAARLGYRHIDTGAMYRALAWKALHDGHRSRPTSRPSRRWRPRPAFETGDGRFASTATTSRRAIRTPEMDAAAAIVARQPRVREALIARQRELGGEGGVVMEGRDIGTVVFPDADVKIYPRRVAGGARPPPRRPTRRTPRAAARRPSRDVATALAERDRSDRTRAASPLVRPPTRS